jgi:hypothetical protein
MKWNSLVLNNTKGGLVFLALSSTTCKQEFWPSIACQPVNRLADNLPACQAG